MMLGFGTGAAVRAAAADQPAGLDRGAAGSPSARSLVVRPARATPRPEPEARGRRAAARHGCATPRQTPPPALTRIRAAARSGGLPRQRPTAIEPFLVDFRGLYRGATPLVACPATHRRGGRGAGDLQRRAASASCRRAATPAIAAAPRRAPAGDQVVLSLHRMNRIRAVDAANFSLVAEAGCVLADVQAAAAGRRSPVPAVARLRRQLPDRRQPVDQCRRPRGACATAWRATSCSGSRSCWPTAASRRAVEPAQGQHRLRPAPPVHRRRGHARRDHGGEPQAVPAAAHGRDRVRRGARHARPRSRCSAGCATATGDCVTSFEYLPRIAVEFDDAPHPGRDATRSARRYPAYVLCEVSTARDGPAAARPARGRARRRACRRGQVLDAAFAESGAQRDGAVAAARIGAGGAAARGRQHQARRRRAGRRAARVPRRRRAAAVARVAPAARLVAYGHVGDGNLHFNLSEPAGGGRPRAFLALQDALGEARARLRARTSAARISAEHGIGQLKRELLGTPQGSGGARRDARHQAGARPARHPESGQGPARLSAPLVTRRHRAVATVRARRW